MICLICRQAETSERDASIKLEYDEFRLVISGVPARICPGCGEIYVEEEVAVRLLHGMEKMYKTGIPEEEVEYKRF